MGGILNIFLDPLFMFVILPDGLQVMGAAIATMLSNIFINRLASGHGDTALAAIGIVLKSERLPLNTGVGLCLGMVPLLAYNYSARNYKHM